MKYMVGKWLWFKITYDKPIIEQVRAYENLCAEVLNENIKKYEIL